MKQKFVLNKGIILLLSIYYLVSPMVFFMINLVKAYLKKQGEIAKDKISTYINDFIAKDSLELLADQCKDGSVLRRMSNEVYTEMFSVIAADAMKNIDPDANESSLIMPNRHGVLHGLHRDYATKTNALKCFSMLLFIAWSIHGDSMMNSGI